MIGRDLVKQTAEDSRDASFVRVSLAFFFICAISEHLFSSIPNL